MGWLGVAWSSLGRLFVQPRMSPANDRWRIRRRLIIIIVVFGLAMIVVGAVGLFADKWTGEMIYGGVTMVTAVLTAYSTMASLDDKWQGVAPEPGEESPDG